MLYEIISPDAFLRPFIDDYATLSAIYAVVRNAYAKKVYVDKAFQQKTNELVQQHIATSSLNDPWNMPCSTMRHSRRSRNDAKAMRRRSSTSSKHREDGGGEQRRSVPDRAGRARQGGPGELRGPADGNRRSAGRAAQRNREERAAQEGTGREGARCHDLLRPVQAHRRRISRTLRSPAARWPRRSPSIRTGGAARLSCANCASR